jgi:cobalt-zinc-cadmium efflux system outer membrane protein
MKKKILLLFYLVIFSGAAWSQSGLTLLDSQKKALENHPALEPFRYDILAQDGFIEQAGLRPNPELDIEIENLLGTGPFQGLDGFETTAAIRQTFETAEKPEKRIQAAEQRKDKVQQEWELARLQVLYQTTNVFIDVSAAQERLKLETSFYDISHQIHENIKTSVEAGRDSPVEEIRARVMVSSTQINLDRTKRNLSKSKLALTEQWGSTEPDFESVTGDLFPLPNALSAEIALEQISSHPELILSEAIVSEKEALLQLETAKATPDFTVGAGIKYHSDQDDGAFVVGVSIPLPLRDRNQGAIRAAGELVQKAESERDALLSQLRSTLVQMYQNYYQAYEEVHHLQDEILPAAQSAFEAVQEGYRQGKFPYINVLDAQRSLFELKIQRLEAATAAHKHFNEINKLTASYELLQTK